MNPAPLARILIVDDEAAQMRALRDTLRDQRYDTAGFTAGEDALKALRESPFDLLLTDLKMPGMDGVELLAGALKIDPQLVGIIMTGKGTIETAVQTMKAGALDYVLKPIKASALLPVLARAVGVRRLRLENLELRNTVAIHELNQAIAHTLDSNVLLDKIADAALAQFEADEVSIMLPADDGRSFYIAAARGEGRDTLLGTRVPIGEGIAGWVAAHCEPLVLEGEVKDPRLAPLRPRAEIQSALSMPMMTRNKLIGVLNINCTRRPRAFAIGQIKVLSIFTNAAAAGIEAARLYEDQRKADARYREVLYMAADGIISIDEEQRIVVYNGGAEKLFGYRVEEVLGKPLEMLLPAEAAEPHRRHVQSFGQGPDQSRRMAARNPRLFGRRKDGTLVDVEVGISKRSENGRLLYTAVVRDITERRRAQQALQESEERFRAMFEKAAVGITHTDLDGRFVMVNPKLCEITGYTQEEAPSLTFRDLTHPDDVQESIEFRARLFEGTMAPYEREARLVRKDRSLIWVNVTTSLVRAADGTPLHLISVLHDVSDRKRAEQELHRSRLAMDMSMDSIYLTDPVTMRFVYVNDAACRRLGYARERLLQMGPQDVLDVDREQIRRDYDEVIAAGEQGMRSESRFVRSDGTQGWTEIHRRALRADSEWLIVTIGRDITERKRTERKIKRLNRVYAVLSGINALIVRVSDRNELFREACRIAVDAGRFSLAWIGIVDREAKQVRPIAWHGAERGLLDLIRDRLWLREEASEADSIIVRAVRTKQAVVSNDLLRDPQIRFGKEYAERGFQSAVALPLIASDNVEATLALYVNESGFFDDEEMRLLTELAGDIAFALEHIEKSEKVDYLAYYDVLTGLANRTLFHERLTQQLLAAAAAQHKVALLIADLERFKSINDSLGRQAGDLLLKRVAERLRSHAPDSVEIARVGTDQFAIVIPNVMQENDVARFTEQGARDCFGAPFELTGTNLKVRAKIGIAMYPNDGSDADTLIRNAEAALDKAKSAGNPYLFFAAAMTEQVAGKLALENQLLQALEKDEFVLHYQPKAELETRRIVGAEALIRWQNPERGLVPPGQFIPVMEETGLILDAGAWALAKAAADHLRWLEQGLPAPRVAVNVSAIQLRRPEFLGTVQEAIRRGATPPGIDLEITESLVMEDVEATIGKLREVKGLGVSIAIDDFGTGYSSLGYLAKLPVQSLKIDRSFIITMLNDPDTMTLVQTIISLAHSLRLKVVAEGVETEEQAKFLHLLRCDEMQGYLFSRPVPFDDMTALLKQGKQG